jgi:hypothetical protein
MVKPFSNRHRQKVQSYEQIIAFRSPRNNGILAPRLLAAQRSCLMYNQNVGGTKKEQSLGNYLHNLQLRAPPCTSRNGPNFGGNLKNLGAE